MNVFVTGAAGFIGSHLCERLLADGHRVEGVDCFIPYYDPTIKRNNLVNCLREKGFMFNPFDLRTDSVESLVENADAVIHLAAMPGLVRSWIDFQLYESCNVLATQRLLEALRSIAFAGRFIYVSTSYVYGRFAVGDEMTALRPVSPYGVTKLAAENLCRAYAEEYGLHLVVMRCFSVYGPRQRPDMAFSSFIRAVLRDEPVTVYGDGRQERSITYVTDCIEAVTSGLRASSGEIYNIGGNEQVRLMDVLSLLQRVSGNSVKILYKVRQAGDQSCTHADCAKMYRHFGWRPTVTLEEGLCRQVAWQRSVVGMDKSS